MSSSSNTTSSRPYKRSKGSSSSLVVMVMDVSPAAWGERDVKRKALDRARQAAGKSSMGPAILEDVLQSLLALCNGIVTLERAASIVVLAVAENECAVVFPRKNQLDEWLSSGKTDVSLTWSPNLPELSHCLHTGVAELLARVNQKNKSTAASPTSVDRRQAAMASAFSTALCLLNRIFVATRMGGVSALQQQNQHYLDRVDDAGVVALMDPSEANNSAITTNRNNTGTWSPRVLLVQASNDRSRDYNAFMNCAFCAKKEGIVVDGCFLTAATNNKQQDMTCATSSRFLEQVCDLTGGVYSAPSGMAQMGGALTEVWWSVFLSPLPCRSVLNLPALNKVDFRARCFETGKTVDTALVCPLCLSIFHRKPTASHCPTCHAPLAKAK